jgi:hypothetical protein
VVKCIPSPRHFRLFQRADLVLTPGVHREPVKVAARLVVKLGTGVLTDDWTGPTEYNRK